MPGGFSAAQLCGPGPTRPSEQVRLPVAGSPGEVALPARGGVLAAGLRRGLLEQALRRDRERSEAPRVRVPRGTGTYQPRQVGGQGGRFVGW